MAVVVEEVDMGRVDGEDRSGNGSELGMAVEKVLEATAEVVRGGWICEIRRIGCVRRTE